MAGHIYPLRPTSPNPTNVYVTNYTIAEEKEVTTFIRFMAINRVFIMVVTSLLLNGSII
ncbi:hypothetical protein [Pontibacillus halophilus]|uniref:hypothetical protein n=1 Tax=Pontibacillus halophilus TaxID=516704 RepID=UPI000429F1BD|nr:hypothetical protein [Pontibacillus halophilus]